MKTPNHDMENRMENDLLSSQKGQNPFLVPDDYFEHLEERINARIDAAASNTYASPATETKPETPVVPLMVKFRPYLYFAAMLVLIFAGVRTAVNLSQPNNTDPSAVLVSEELLQSDLTAEEFLMGSLNASSVMYYLFEDNE